MICILAAGSQKRWGKSNPRYPIKQLVPINGEPLLERTIRQLRDRGLDPYVITHKKELELASVIRPIDNRFAVSSLYSFLGYAEPRNLCLLGDVYFTERGLDTCLSLGGDIHFAGRRNEIFAVYWENTDKLSGHLKKCIDYATHNKTRYTGKLWTLYRSVIGVPMEEHRHNKKYYTFIKDDSRDFDKWSEYEKFAGRSQGVL